jgi:hypothetical protein
MIRFRSLEVKMGPACLSHLIFQLKHSLESLAVPSASTDIQMLLSCYVTLCRDMEDLNHVEEPGSLSA